ncbi:hypothetical protein PICMEDRAFT_16386 [Pichia membranifaciens NRRL Y-2026]|uniref:Uncharacterized protein n=1 Tax=Pichia membranifaciens NRRL Y-2026 TaxID=763406 RepID=A0A1E3NKA3_9ASCO|nr:hypothetical protein PICMEDRAFT_16386 [Pichia membranifaciens NRRL Y-2026]ODQ46516.1 hypothetical protein PICMEDRAFT_16386 [Pichia membranifaciens NRRL Y-2026]
MFSPPSSTDYDDSLGNRPGGRGHGHGSGNNSSSNHFGSFSFSDPSSAAASASASPVSSVARRKASKPAASKNIDVPAATIASNPTHSSNLGIHSPLSLESAKSNDSQDPGADAASSHAAESVYYVKHKGGPGSKSATSNDRKSSLDNDQFSLASSISRSSMNSRADDSLIFERLVQDPLTDAQPIPHSLPRHVSSEAFIPASLDTTTHMILNNDDPMEEMSNDDPANPSGVQLGFSSRRSSLANLEAALGHSSAASSRRPSIANLQSSFGMNSSYRLNSSSTNTLSRSQTNSSFSNLTQQFQNSNSSRRIPQSQPLSQSLSQNSQNSAPNIPPAGASNLPPLTTSLTSSSVNSLTNQRNPSSSPVLKNKSFCSYADIIAQDDHESKFQIRRPSISLSLNNQKLARTNSMSSASQICGCNSPRSPSNCAPSSFANNLRSNSTVSNILLPPNNANNNTSANISTSNNNKIIRGGSPSVKSDSNYIPLPSFALESDNRDYPINNVNNNNTPRRSGFSGRPIVNTGGHTMRLSNSNSSYNSNNYPGSNFNSPSHNLKKNELPSSNSRSIQNELISDDESIKSFKTANLPTE